MSKCFIQLTARLMLVVMSCIFTSPGFAQGLVQTHAQSDPHHASGSNAALERHLRETTLSYGHHERFGNEGDHDGDHDNSLGLVSIGDVDHHRLAAHNDKDANGEDLPSHEHENAHNFIGHVFGHMPVLFSVGITFYIPPSSRMTRVDLQTPAPLVVYDAPFRPPRFSNS